MLKITGMILNKDAKIKKKLLKFIFMVVNENKRSLGGLSISKSSFSAFHLFPNSSQECLDEEK